MASLVKGAGDLRDRVLLQSRDLVVDRLGNEVPAGGWVTRVSVAAHLYPLNGSEAAIGARLEGRQPFTLTVRRSVKTLAVTEHWRAVDARDDRRVFSIVSPPVDPDGKRMWLQMTAVQGGRS